MKGFMVAAALAVGSFGCNRDPHYTLPDGVQAPAVALVQAVPGTIDLGGDADELCVIQSISQFGVAGSGAVDADADADADADDSTGNGGDAGIASPIAQVDLYFDTTTSTWHLSSSGAVSATIACASWSSFGGAQALTRFDNGGGNTYPLGGYTAPSPSQTVGTDGQGACFLSDLEGDFVADGNVASLDGSSLTVSNESPTGDAIYASATCVHGAQSIAFQDFSVDAVTGALSVPVPANDRALCGLSALGSLTQSGSSLVVSDGHALGFHAFGVVRCFLFDVPDAAPDVE